MGLNSDSFIIVDGAGTPHSLARRLRLKAKELKAKLADLNPKDFQTVEEVQFQIKSNIKEIQKMAEQQPFEFAIANEDDDDSTLSAYERQKYWRSKGATKTSIDDQGVLWFTLYGQVWKDYGNRIVLHTNRPSGKQITAMVTAGRERGWERIRFSGGDED